MRTLAALLLLSVAGTALAAPPPQCTLPPRDVAAADDRLTALERRVAELCERLDRPAGSNQANEFRSPGSVAGLEVQGAPPAAYAAACGPNGCGSAPVTNPTFSAPGGPFGAYFSGPYGAVTGPAFGGGCSGGSCGAQAPAGGFLRAGLFRGRR
jgi:hypothetical protein